MSAITLRDWINLQVQAPAARAELRRKLARHLKIKPQGVGHWYSGLRPIPPRYGAEIEKFTCGAITALQVSQAYQAAMSASRRNGSSRASA